MGAAPHPRLSADGLSSPVGRAGGWRAVSWPCAGSPEGSCVLGCSRVKEGAVPFCEDQHSIQLRGPARGRCGAVEVSLGDATRVLVEPERLSSVSGSVVMALS